MAELELKLLLSDSDTQLAKSQIRDYLIKIFSDCKSLDEKRNNFWHLIVEYGWSCQVMDNLLKKNRYSEDILDFEAQMVEDVMRDMGYEFSDDSDDFC